MAGGSIPIVPACHFYLNEEFQTMHQSSHPLAGRNEKELINVALGIEPADLVILNGNLINVYTGELLEACSVSIKDKWIAYVGNDPDMAIGPRTTVIDAQGKTVIPGLIDGHTHIAWLYSAVEFLRFAMQGGTTTIVTETMEAFPVCGYDGVVDFMASVEDQPVKIFGTAPAMVSTSKAHRIPLGTLRKLLTRDDMLGLGESYWQAILQEPDHLIPVLKEAVVSGKRLEGHTAGARGKKLAAYMATGISSCHEPIKTDEVIERLRLGMHVMIREGSIRSDLEAISEIKNLDIDTRRLILVTDGIDPETLMGKGYLEFVVQKAIDCGFDPITAIQMATLNVAEHFGLDDQIGGIAPGKYADVLVIPDPATIEAEYVISSGEIIAQNGTLLKPPRAHHFSKSSLNSVHLPRKLEPADFRIQIQVDDLTQTVRIIDQITDLVTMEVQIILPVADGEIRSDFEKDVIKVAAIDRVIDPGKMFVGLIRGYHMQTGAIASSAAWDTSDIIVVGADDADMALAVNRIHEIQGGAVVCAQGRILTELPLPIMGLISNLSMEQLAERRKAFKKATTQLGIPFDDPLLSLITLTGAAIPYLRICEEGLVNIKDGRTVGLVIDEKPIQNS